MNGGSYYGKTGYNKDEIDKLNGVVDQIRGEIVEEIENAIQTVFVHPMSTMWHAPEAVKEFAGLKQGIASLGTTITSAFTSFLGWCKQAGDAWAENTEGERPSENLASLDDKLLNIDVECITDNSNGNITLDVNGAEAIAQRMAELKDTLLEVVKRKQAKLEAQTSFIGGDQSAALKDCFKMVGDSVSSIFGVTDELSDLVKQYAQKYRDAADDIANKMRNASLNVTSN